MVGRVVTGDRREYQRQWAARRRRAAGIEERPTGPEHGTAAAYRRHRYRDEEPCSECREAWAAYNRDRYRARHSGGA